MCILRIAYKIGVFCCLLIIALPVPAFGNEMSNLNLRLQEFEKQSFLDVYRENQSESKETIQIKIEEKKYKTSKSLSNAVEYYLIKNYPPGSSYKRISDILNLSQFQCRDSSYLSDTYEVLECTNKEFIKFPEFILREARLKDPTAPEELFYFSSEWRVLVFHERNAIRKTTATLRVGRDAL